MALSFSLIFFLRAASSLRLDSDIYSSSSLSSSEVTGLVAASSGYRVHEVDGGDRVGRCRLGGLCLVLVTVFVVLFAVKLFHLVPLRRIQFSGVVVFGDGL